MEAAHHPIRLPASLTDGIVLLDAHRLEDAACDLAGEDDDIRRRFDGGRPTTLGALGLLVQAAAGAMDGLVEISAHIEPDNIASLRTAKAAGFREAGSVVENGVTRLRLVRRP